MRARTHFSSWIAAGLLALLFASDAWAQPGALSQLAGTDACVSEDGSGGACADGFAVLRAVDVAVSPDGRNVYVAGWGRMAVAVLARDKKTGALTQLAGTDACVDNAGFTAGACAVGVALERPDKIAVSRDGKHVYAAAYQGDSVAVLARDEKTGVLTQLPGTDACVTEDGSGGACADGKALESPTGIVVSRDGKNVYVTSRDAVAIFARDKKTGVLTQLAGTDGCVSEDGSSGACADGRALDAPAGIAVSRDGKYVYVASRFSNGVAIFARDKKTGALSQAAGTDGCITVNGSSGCTFGIPQLTQAFSVAASPDGKNLYVTTLADAVVVLSRDRKTGAPAVLAGTDGCVSEDGGSGACADGQALDTPVSVTVSPDGKNVYVTSSISDAVAIFARDKKTGVLTQLAGTDGCVSEDGSSGACADGQALDRASSVALSPKGRNAYVASIDSDAVAVFARQKK